MGDSAGETLSATMPRGICGAVVRIAATTKGSKDFSATGPL